MASPTFQEVSCLVTNGLLCFLRVFNQELHGFQTELQLKKTAMLTADIQIMMMVMSKAVLSSVSRRLIGCLQVAS